MYKVGICGEECNSQTLVMAEKGVHIRQVNRLRTTLVIFYIFAPFIRVRSLVADNEEKSIFILHAPVPTILMKLLMHTTQR